MMRVFKLRIKVSTRKKERKKNPIQYLSLVSSMGSDSNDAKGEEAGEKEARQVTVAHII